MLPAGKLERSMQVISACGWDGRVPFFWWAGFCIICWALLMDILFQKLETEQFPACNPKNDDVSLRDYGGSLATWLFGMINHLSSKSQTFSQLDRSSNSSTQIQSTKRPTAISVITLTCFSLDALGCIPVKLDSCRGLQRSEWRR